MFEKLLEDDMSVGDITSELTVPAGLKAQAEIIVKEDCVLAGLEFLGEKVARHGLKIDIFKGEGENVKKGDSVALIEGDARRILFTERVFLNLLGRMSGIATMTRRIVEKARRFNPHVRIAATRKTLLGHLDKMAVAIGGGDPHRWGLSDHILVKDNHIALVGLEDAIQRVKQTSFVRKIEVEVESIEDALKTARLGVDVVMLDNFLPTNIRKVTELLEREGLRGRVMLEASGGINEENVEEYAKCGVDIISIGVLTHSVRSIDFSLEVKKKDSQR